MAYYFKGNGFSFEINKRTYIMGILNVTPDSFLTADSGTAPKRRSNTLSKCKRTEPI